MKALKAYLSREGITQTELAKRLGVTPIEVNRWVRGNRSPSLENRRLMVKRLGIPAADVL